MEELGRGAYGKVHKGVMKELPKKEVFFKPREERVDVGEGRIVAVKVLLGEKIVYIVFKFTVLASEYFSNCSRQTDRQTTSQKDRQTDDGMCYIKMVKIMEILNQQ